MHITIKGGTSTQKKYAKSLAKFAGDKLMGKRLSNRVDLHIELIDGDIDGNPDMYGDCIWEDEDYRPREFTVRVCSKVSLRSMLTSLAHEIVHVKQYAKDELRELSNRQHRYQGKYYKEHTHYWDQPWEIEAHGREVGLFVQWAEANDLAKNKWTQEIKI